MQELTELILTEPRGPDDYGAATSRTLRRDLSAMIEGFHAVIHTPRSDRAAGTTGWTAYAVAEDRIVVCGVVANVALDVRSGDAVIDIEPPARVFPTAETVA